MPDQENYNAWLDNIYQPTAKKYPERKTEFKTSSGIPLPAIIPPEQINPDWFDLLGLIVGINMGSVTFQRVCQ